MKPVVAVAAALALLIIGCPLGVVLLVAPTTGAGLGVHAAAQAAQLAGSGQLRPDAPVPEPNLPLVLAAGQVCPQIGPAHIAAQIEVESGWNPLAYTDAGEVPAHGIAQFTMPTWETWGGDYRVDTEPTAAGPRLVITGGDQPGDPYQPANAIIAQAHLMCYLHQWADSQLAAGRLAGATALDLAWATYFCGRGCILDYGGIPPAGLAAEYPGRIRAALSRYATVGHVAVDGWVHPLPPGSYTFTSGFGMRWGGLHAGIDLAAATGTPIHAAADGVVQAAGCTSPRCDIPGSPEMAGCGWRVNLDHGGGIVTRYCHAVALNVTAGQKVVAGQVIGWVGSTGNSSGPHLHFETHRGPPPATNDTAVDAAAFLRTVGVEI
jgi:murein DD-endopeptidase MepM/ murein hydrolase activator NlpD